MTTILSFRELMETDIAAALKRIPFAEYPPELLAARRARFVEAVRADRCPECSGRGYSWSEYSLQDEYCDECDGTGQKCKS